MAGLEPGMSKVIDIGDMVMFRWIKMMSVSDWLDMLANGWIGEGEWGLNGLVDNFINGFG